MGAHAKGERRMEKKEEKEPQTIVEAEKTAQVDEIPADTIPIDTTATEQPMPEEPEIKVKNPRMEKVLELKREAERQSELEEIRTKRIHKVKTSFPDRTNIFTEQRQDQRFLWLQHAKSDQRKPSKR